ncbi:HARBI1 [Mytilus coruscus]|uniref:HARBI1 n=1 Tax=Mytilus coruscus TaxID=42192 RepID=A0A6J8DP21_MYTCO|nr:HARBI1 [Mytilus coruscus]
MAAAYIFLRRRQQNIRRNRLLRDYDNPLDYLDDIDIIRSGQEEPTTLSFGQIRTCVKCIENRTLSEGWLLCDSGYPLRSWLMTPVLNPTTRKQQRYNGAQIKTKNVVEMSFGVLKARFRCIDTSAGTLLYTPIRCCRIVIAVVVLHNMCIDNRLPLPVNGNDFPDHGHIDRPPYNEPLNVGIRVRERLINGRF